MQFNLSFVACLFLFVSLSVPCGLRAQAKHASVKGRIVDSVSSPLSFATIALLNQKDSSIVKGIIGDETGTYFFDKIKKGSYLIKGLAAGYSDTYGSAFSVDSSSNLVLPDLVLKSKSLNLDEINVTAMKSTIEFKAGNIIVNVENSPLAKGNSVFDLLYKLPGVSIDDQTITLQGKSGVTVLIDGRPQKISNQQLVALLKSMNSELVERIEILKNPPAKYDASGTSGMIDIRTKKAKLTGLNGSIYAAPSQGFYSRSMEGIALNYKTQHLVLFSRFDYNYNIYQAVEHLNRNFSGDSGTTHFNEDNIRILKSSTMNFAGGADWTPDSRNTIGFKVDGETGNSPTRGNGIIRLNGFDNLGYNHMTSSINVPDNWNLINYNINVSHSFDTTGTSISFSSDYTRLREVNASYNENLFFSNVNTGVLPANIYQTNNNSLSDIFTSRLDIAKPLNNSTSLEAGFKSGFAHVANDYLFAKKNDITNQFETDPSISNNYRYNETTLAAYANLIKSFKRINVQAGLRAENTVMAGSNVDKNFGITRTYFNLFPNLVCEYSPSENHNFQVNANRRIDRPQYSDLNPFRWYKDQYSFYQGNPFVMPHFSISAELTYTWKKTISNSFGYTRIDRIMEGYTVQNDTTKVMTQSVKNMDYYESYTYSFFLKKQVTRWWELSANAIASYMAYKGNIGSIPFYSSCLYYNGYINNAFLLPGSTRMEMNFFYRGPKYNGTLLAKSRWMLSFAVKRSFLNGKLSGSVGIEDIFYTLIPASASNFYNQDWNYAVKSDTRRLTLSISYNFGRTKINAVSKNSNEQEKGRLNH